jgi:hypothetical protein
MQFSSYRFIFKVNYYYNEYYEGILEIANSLVDIIKSVGGEYNGCSIERRMKELFSA